MNNRLLMVAVAALAAAGCASSSSGGTKPSDSPSTSAQAGGTTTGGAAVAIVVRRYGDCIDKLGDSRRGQVLPSSNDAHTYVGFGPKPLRFSVTGLNGKTYTIPADERSARTLTSVGC